MKIEEARQKLTLLLEHFLAEQYSIQDMTQDPIDIGFPDWIKRLAKYLRGLP